MVAEEGAPCEGMKTDLFQSWGHCRVFQICWHIECSTFTPPRPPRRRPPPPGDGGESAEGRGEGGGRGREERGAGKIRRAAGTAGPAAGLNPPGGLRGPHPFTS